MVGLVNFFQSLNTWLCAPGACGSRPLRSLPVLPPVAPLSPKLVGRAMWQGQNHTPGDPCSQSGPLLLLPPGCGARIGLAHLAPTLLQPREPHPAVVTSSLFWSERFRQEGARIGSPSICASSSSMSCLLIAAQRLREAGTQQPGLCPQVGHPNLWDPRGSRAPGRAILLTPEGGWDTGEVSGQHIG